MQIVSVDPNIQRWQLASQNAPKDIRSNAWKTVGLVALAVLVGGGAIAGSSLLLHYGCKVDDIGHRGLTMGGAMALLASFTVSILALDGTVMFCVRYFDWHKYNDLKEARKLASELLNASIEQLALEWHEMPNSELQSLNLGYINLEGYEYNGIIGKNGEESMKDKLLQFRREYRQARDQMQYQYLLHKGILDQIERKQVVKDLAGVHAHLKDYYQAKQKIEEIKRDLKSYQENVLKPFVPLPLAENSSF